MEVDKEDCAKVVREIEQCQARVLNTLIPTVLALSLIAFSGSTADSTSDFSPYFAMGITFAVLLTTSLYVASLSQKIFMNAGFLSVFVGRKPDTIYWENIVTKFRKLTGKPKVIHSETTTAAFIYIILAVIYIFIFASLGAVRESQGALTFLVLSGLILLLVAVRIYWTYYDSERQKVSWQQIYDQDYGDDAKISSNQNK